MIPLAKLKKDVEFNQELTYVIDALKGIALAKFHHLQRRLKVFERFTHEAGDILSLINLDVVQHPFVGSKNETASVLMVTSDQGFLGGLNSQVVTEGIERAGAGGHLTILGERGANTLRAAKKSFKDYPGIQENQNKELPFEVRDHLMNEVLSGKSGKVYVVYPKPISLAIQKITVETILPCQDWVSKVAKPQSSKGYIWESSPSDVLSYIVSEFIGHRLQEIFAMSRIAELAARVMHLEGSYQELLRQGKKLKHEYFRARHEIIDRSMREVFAAQLLFGKLKNEEELKQILGDIELPEHLKKDAS